MQIVAPVDVEDALRLELDAATTHVTCCAAPAPDALTANTVCVTRLGGGSQGPVAHEHDLSIDCWSTTPKKAMALADQVQAIVATLPIRTSVSGVTWTTSSPMVPYPNPDPHRPLLPRATFRATVGARGVPVTFTNPSS